MKNSKQTKITQLDQDGISHLILPIVAVLLVGVVGTYMLVASHADSVTTSVSPTAAVDTSDSADNIVDIPQASTLSTTPGTSATKPSISQTNKAAIITKGSAEIDQRLATLAELKTTVANSKKLSDANRSALNLELDSAIAGLTALKAKLAADSTPQLAKADAKKIFLDYRIYALLKPKVGLITHADAQMVTVANLTERSANYKDRIAKQKAKGKDVTALQAKLDEMNNLTASASPVSIAVEAAVIGLKPANYNANHKILDGYKAKLEASRAVLDQATTASQAVNAGFTALNTKR